MSSSTPVIVYVHGIGQHSAGYSNYWFDALQPHLTTPVEKQEVVWSDLVNARAILGAEDAATIYARTTAEEAFHAKLAAELASRTLKIQGAQGDGDAGPTKTFREALDSPSTTSSAT